MEEFSIIGDKGNYLKISFQEVYGFPESTCHWGGYELRATVEIKSGSFIVKSIVWTSTGEIYKFYENLKICNDELKGLTRFANYEDNLEFIIKYDDFGHVNIKGRFHEFTDFDNELKFEFNSDQTFISSTLESLERIIIKYGDMKGLRK